MPGQEMIVVTSDYAVQKSIFGYGACRMSTRGFDFEIKKTFKSSKKNMARKSYSSEKCVSCFSELLDTDKIKELRQITKARSD